MQFVIWTKTILHVEFSSYKSQRRISSIRYTCSRGLYIPNDRPYRSIMQTINTYAICELRISYFTGFYDPSSIVDDTTLERIKFTFILTVQMAKIMRKEK